MGIEAGTIGTQMVIDNDGNVGIGTPSPAAHLQIHHATLATARLTAGSHTSGYDMLLDSGGNAYLYNRNNGVLTFGTNNTERMRITSTGNVGIGTTAPGVALQVVGVGQATGGFTTGSDKRWKKNITPLKSALNMVMKLQGVNYNFRIAEFPELKFSAEP